MANLHRIRDLCLEKKITLKDLANKVRISEVGLQRIIKTNSTKVDTLEKIAKALDVDIYEFFPNADFDFQINLYDILENKVLKFMSSRHKSFYEKLSLYKDIFVWNVLILTVPGKSPKFPCIEPNKWDEFLSENHKQKIYEIPDEMISKPFSLWKLEKKIHFNTEFRIIEAFYIMIFESNFLNISEYLQDGLIKDKEILRYYKVWKKE